nr:MAG TPA: SatD family (SatD) [Caudoviricetes sp.]
MTYQKIGEIMNVSFTTIRERLIEIGYNEVKK